VNVSPLDAKERVRQATDIVELASQYLQLKRQGRNFVALCPWHDDTHPSLQINPERQSFKCWVCDIGGDVFSFMMQIEGVEFREALEMLAERAGVEVKQAPRPKLAGSGQSIDKQALYRATAWVEQQYHECLLHDEAAQSARDYLESRGITADSIARFQLGLAPLQRDWLQRRLAQRGGDRAMGLRMLETIGAIARGESGSLYERFRGRLLFSIRDAQGRPVGIGGRLIPGIDLESPAKYVNSPESPLFSKHRLLYGLDLAREPIRRQGTAIVVEGYTDVIVAHQEGFQNTVAVLGTALGENHVRLLKRYADRIVLLLDGDEAGQRRAAEVLELFIAAQADLRIVTLPSGMDPCDFLQEHGADALAERMEREAVDALDHAFQVHTRGVDLDRDVHAASEALERILALFSRAPRLTAGTPGELRLREQKALQRVAAAFRLPEEEIRRRLSELRRRGNRSGFSGGGSQASQQRPPHAVDAEALAAGIVGDRLADGGGDETSEEPTAEQMAEISATVGEGTGGARMDQPGAVSTQGPTVRPPAAWERELMELLVVHPHLVAETAGAVRSEQFGHAALRLLFETACRLAATAEGVTFDRLTLEFDQPAMQSLLVDLDEKGRVKGSVVEDPEALLKELIQTIQREEVHRQDPARLARLRDGGLDEQQEQALLAEILQQARQRHGISEPTDG